MLKHSIFVLLVIGLVACTTSKVVVKPPITEVCGNAICESNETLENCPADCKPVVTDVCGDGKCTGNETPSNCASDCKTKPVPVVTRDFTKFISAGFYSLLAQSNTNVEAFFAGLPKQVNFVSIFGLSGWLNYEGFYPWSKTSTGYDHTKIDPKWKIFVTKVFETAAKYDVGIEWCFFTRYLEGEHWSKYKGYGLKVTPFCHSGNTEWCKDSRTLYENWNRQSVSDCKNFAWLCWVAGADDIVLSAKGVGKNGSGNVLYIKAVADIAKETKKKFPNFKIYVRPYNEEDNKWVEDHRIENYIDMEFKARGFKVGTGYRVIENSTVWVANRNYDDPIYKQMDLGAMKKNLSWLMARQRWYEIHNCDSTLASKLKELKFDMNSVICDMDAVDDSEIDKEARLLLKMNLPKMGIKPSDYWIEGGIRFKDANFNLKEQLPELNKIFKSN